MPMAGADSQVLRTVLEQSDGETGLELIAGMEVSLRTGLYAPHSSS